jgi:hypothetical protein
MKIYLRNTAHGLIPLYDEDYDEKKKLEIGRDYQAEIKPARKLSFHNKYFSLINCAWNLLTQRARDFFGTKEKFRKSLLIAAGHCEPIYNHKLKSWVDIPKSLAFDKMKEDEFEDVYRDCRDVLLKVFLRHITPEQFDEHLINY